MPARSIEPEAYVPPGKRARYQSPCQDQECEDQSIKDEPLENQTSRDALSSAPNIPWNEGEGPYMRATLVFMKRVYYMTGKEMCDIFWFLFEYQLRRWGQHHDEQLLRKLQSQCAELTRKSKANFTILFIVPFEDLRQLCSDMDEKILSAASFLGLDLDARECDIPDCYCFYPNWRELFQATFPHCAGPGFVDLCQDQSDQSERYPSLSPYTEHMRMLNPQEQPTDLPSSRKVKAPQPSAILHVADDEPVPLTLFRFFDKSSHGINAFSTFRAARFNRPGCHVPPLPYGSPELLDDAEKHLYTKNFDSPFISTTNSFIWALHKALKNRSANSSNKGYISCILGHSAANHTGTLHVKRIVQQLRAANRARAQRYRAEYEYFVWGEVDSSSIVSSVPLSRLEALSREDVHVLLFLHLNELSGKTSLPAIMDSLNIFPPDFETGKAIGKVAGLFLENSPYNNYSRKSPLVGDLVRGFLQNWRIEVDLDNWDTYPFLIQGIDFGLEYSYAQRFGPLLLSKMPQTPPRQASRNAGLLTPPTTIQRARIVGNDIEERASSPPYSRTSPDLSPDRHIEGWENPEERASSSPYSRTSPDLIPERHIEGWEIFEERVSSPPYSSRSPSLSGGSPTRERNNSDTSSGSWKKDCERVLGLLREDDHSHLTGISDDDLGQEDGSAHDGSSLYWFDNGAEYPAPDPLPPKDEDLSSTHCRGGSGSSSSSESGSSKHTSHALELTAYYPHPDEQAIPTYLDEVLEKHRQDVDGLLGSSGSQSDNSETEIKREDCFSLNGLETNATDNNGSKTNREPVDDFKYRELEAELQASFAQERRSQLVISSNAR